MALSELQQNIRRGAIQTLQLIASPQAQLEYQKNVRIADVTAELFCSWEDYRIEEEPLPHWCADAFSAAELKVLKEFNGVLNDVAEAMPYSGLPIEEFVSTPLSSRLAEAAELALHAFRSETKHV